MPYLRYGTWSTELSKEDEEEFGGEMDYSSIDWDCGYKTTDSKRIED